MWQPGVAGHLHLFRVNHNHLHFIRPRFVENTTNQGVHTNAFTRTSGAGNQQVGHFRQIAHNSAAVDVNAQSNADFGLALAEILRTQNVLKVNRAGLLARHLNAHHRFAGHRGLNAQTTRRQGQGNIVRQIDNAGNFHPWGRLQLIANNGGPANHFHHLSFHAKAGQHLLQAHTIVHNPLVDARVFHHNAAFHQGKRRQLIIHHPLKLSMYLAALGIDRRRLRFWLLPFSFFYYIIFIYTIFFKNFILNIIFGNISLGQAVLNICFILNPFFAIIFNIIFN